MHDSYTISTIMTSEGKRHFNILPLLCYYCTHPIFARVDFSKVRIAPVTVVDMVGLCSIIKNKNL